MRLNRRQLLFWIFLSPVNPLWEDLLGRDYPRSRFNGTIVNSSTLTYWNQGRPFRKDMLSQTFDKVRAELTRLEADRKMSPATKAGLEARLDEFENGLPLDTYDVDAAAKTLLMDRDAALRVIDEQLFKRTPLFASLVYDNRNTELAGAAEEDFERYRGVYHLWVKRNDRMRGKIWLRGALRVRYLAAAGDGRVIRCKLNFPIINPQRRENIPGALQAKKHFEYDGFIACQNNQQPTFLFEKRWKADIEDKRIDHFNFITDRGNTEPDGQFRLYGQYLTLDQAQRHSIVTGDIILERVGRDDPVKKLYALMRTAKVLTSSEAKRPERLLANYNKRERMH